MKTGRAGIGNLFRPGGIGTYTVGVAQMNLIAGGVEAEGRITMPSYKSMSFRNSGCGDNFETREGRLQYIARSPVKCKSERAVVRGTA